MSGFTFNIAKGRTIEYHARVVNNDPANSALILVVLAALALESDDVLQDYDTLSALLAGASNEVTNASYARKVLTNADLSAPTIDDTANTVTVFFPTQTFPTIGVGDSWKKLLVCYDSDTTGGTDANIVPMYGIDLLIQNTAVIPTGDDIVVAMPDGYAVAS